MQLLPRHSSPKSIRHHARLQKVSRCSYPALHAGKVEAKPLGFCSHTILITASKQGGASPISLGLAQRLPISWDFMPNAVGAVTQRARCGPCPVAVDLDPFTERSQHQGRAALTLLPNIIAVLEEIKDAFGQTGNQKGLVFLLLFHK